MISNLKASRFLTVLAVIFKMTLSVDPVCATNQDFFAQDPYENVKVNLFIILPDELVQDILLKLDISSLSQVSKLCRRGNILVGDPPFQRGYFNCHFGNWCLDTFVFSQGGRLMRFKKSSFPAFMDILQALTLFKDNQTTLLEGISGKFSKKNKGVTKWIAAAIQIQPFIKTEKKLWNTLQLLFYKSFTRGEVLGNFIKENKAIFQNNIPLEEVDSVINTLLTLSSKKLKKNEPYFSQLFSKNLTQEDRSFLLRYLQIFDRHTIQLVHTYLNTVRLDQVGDPYNPFDVRALLQELEHKPSIARNMKFILSFFSDPSRLGSLTLRQLRDFEKMLLSVDYLYAEDLEILCCHYETLTKKIEGDKRKAKIINALALTFRGVDQGRVVNFINHYDQLIEGMNSNDIYRLTKNLSRMNHATKDSFFLYIPEMAFEMRDLSVDFRISMVNSLSRLESYKATFFLKKFYNIIKKNIKLEENKELLRRKEKIMNIILYFDNFLKSGYVDSTQRRFIEDRLLAFDSVRLDLLRSHYHKFMKKINNFEDQQKVINSLMLAFNSVDIREVLEFLYNHQRTIRVMNLDESLYFTNTLFRLHGSIREKFFVHIPDLFSVTNLSCNFKIFILHFLKTLDAGLDADKIDLFFRKLPKILKKNAGKPEKIEKKIMSLIINL